MTRVWKKYKNKKLFEIGTSSWGTLNGIAAAVKEGAQVQVIEHETGRDITTTVLLQAMALDAKRSNLVIDQSGLRRLFAA